jgi:hypothetical protein
MAEEKKRKIDLKARLGKTGVNPVAQVPPPAAGIPVPAAGVPGGPPPSRPPPQGGLPVPPGVPIGPPPAFGKAPGAGLDPSNPLAAAVAPPYRAPAPAPAQPQRIEVDELSLQEARKGARKQGLIAGLLAAVVFGVVGFIAGGAQETNKARQRSVADAKSLAGDVEQARVQLKSVSDKLEAGRDQLRQRKFPDELARELGGINVDFDGRKLAGVRFSGYPQETTTNLIEFITGVQEVNDRKSALAGILARLQKPLSEQFSAGAKTNISHVVLLGKRDPSGNHFALLAPLTTPIEVSNPAQISLPAELTASDPTAGGANVSAPPYKGGSVDKGAAVYVLPKSVEAAFPSESAGQVPMLVGQLNRLITDIKGEDQGTEDIVRDSKAGLLERAEKLVVGLNKVQ